MVATSTKGTKIQAVSIDATGTEITATDVSAAKPAVVTTADTSGMQAGEMIWLPAGATGFDSIDNQWWIVGGLLDGAGLTFELVGSDTTGEQAAAVIGAPMRYYVSADMVTVCFGEITFNAETPESISVGTFCDPSATIASPVVAAGTIDFSGYPDITQEDYQWLHAMSASGDKAQFNLILPANGNLVFGGTLSMSVEVPLEGAIGYTGTINLSSKARHLF